LFNRLLQSDRYCAGNGVGDVADSDEELRLGYLQLFPKVMQHVPVGLMKHEKIDVAQIYSGVSRGRPPLSEQSEE
jgi:hypothetical protein